ncbi:transglycosylase domain-containing protein [Dysgonomonas sp. 25]|uniref:transglycosylase domain-containing protein n=1 Tax=Dysgonomonas sp. 25 TaxID=2302933 RepID=UPI002103154F|nr:transglycosylase domain-containing protein [Dysgonomonas sp. 25]
MWMTFLGGIVALILIFVLIANGIIGYMPDLKDMENPIDKYASQVYSADGELLGTFSQAKNNRIYSDYSDLPQHIVDALVSTEDVRYYSHSGVDGYALGRVLGKTILTGKSSGGGSTISQQLAKLLYTKERASNIIERGLQKPIEWVIAVRLERSYTKEEIINFYFNQFDFLNNAVGIKSAAQVYFGKEPKDLTIEEAATLVGMCQNPAMHNPASKNPKRVEAALTRRNVVMFQMFNNGKLTRQEYDSLKQIPMKLNFRRVDHKDGLAPYFREYLRTTMQASKPDKSRYGDWQAEQYVRDSARWEGDPLYGWCNKNVKPDGTKYNLTTDGLKIYTTIDSRMQRYAEESLVEHMSKTVQPQFDKEKKGRDYAPFAYRARKDVDKILARAMKQTDRYRNMKKAGHSEKEIEKAFKEPVEMKVFSYAGQIDTTMTPMDSIRYHMKFMRSGFMAMDTYTGHVKSYVGGIDFSYFQYDMVNRGRRQVGSTIKPFLYSLSMEEGATPCDEMLYQQQTIITETGEPWTPRGIKEAKVGEMVSIKWGLQNSDNMVTVYLMGRTSPYSFARLLRSFGITGHIDPVPSMALGATDVTVAEMAAAYTAFANKGIRSKPLYVTRVENSHGNVITDFTPETHEVFSEKTYVKMLDMLRAVVDGGTGYRMRRLGVEGPMGGKTGTTNYNADGWFMAFSPRLSTACWVGGEDINIHFDRMAEGQGAAMALPITGNFFKKVYADKQTGYSPEDEFEKVEGFNNPCAEKNAEEPTSTVTIDNMFN